MFRMAVGHSDEIDVADALATVFAACDAALGGATPTAGLLLATWEADHQEILEAIHRRYPGVALVGRGPGGGILPVMGFPAELIPLALFASDTVEITVGL